ncbi:MAG: tetratricopeptide repeat protein [Bacteroidetes bacterium]|nr:tetratricopeptide repeat protein [Bacteroidota bacterium]MDA0898492.1 tetratricopeptide repeat protein [Bacteroidota bacterium]
MIAVLLMVVVSCQPSPEQGTSEATTSAVTTSDSALYYLEVVERNVLTPAGYTRAAAHFVAQDSLIKTDASYLMKAGLTCMNQEGKYRLYGVNYLILLTNKFPQDRYAPEALLQLALFFDSELGESERAVEFLRVLLKRYPEHALATDAQALLDLISVSETGEIQTVRDWLNNE